MQEGYSQPVALVLQEDKDQVRILNQAGYRCFTSMDELRSYLEGLVGAGTGEKGYIECL